MNDIPNMIAECSLCGGQIILPLANQSNYYACQKCKMIQGPYKMSGSMTIFIEQKTDEKERQP